MNAGKFPSAILLLLLSLYACSGIKPAAQHPAGIIDTTVSRAAVIRSVFLVGDAGVDWRYRPAALPQNLHDQLQESPSGSALIFLGDNIYPAGMPDSLATGRAAAENVLQAHKDVYNDFRGEVIYLPGNHDWNLSRKGGWDAVLQQQEWLRRNAPAVKFVPGSACPGPLAIPLDSGPVILAMDTEWMLHKHAKPGKNEGCSAGSAEEATAQLREMLKAYPGRDIIVAAHHPLFSQGNHGGYYGLKEHIFPLTMPWRYGYIPLPIIGTLAVLMRKSGLATRQDLPHPAYKRMKSLLTDAMKARPGIFYISGHEHGLQYFLQDSIHYVVSGSAGPLNKVYKSGPALFTAQEHGFARIDFLKNGSKRLNFYAADSTTKGGRIIYSLTIDQ